MKSNQQSFQNHFQILEFSNIEKDTFLQLFRQKIRQLFFVTDDIRCVVAAQKPKFMNSALTLTYNCQHAQRIFFASKPHEVRFAPKKSELR